MVSAVNSPILINASGTLLSDNSATALANRISDSATIAMNGGSIQLVGNGTTAVNELAGSLNVSSFANVTVTQPGSAAANWFVRRIQSQQSCVAQHCGAWRQPCGSRQRQY